MKYHRQITAALVAVITAGVAACGSSSSPGTSGSPSAPASSGALPSSGTLTVWLMSGSAPVALSGSGVGQSCNSSGVTTTTAGAWVTGWEALHPGWTVNVDCQSWTGIVTKTDTALASSSPPDALEMGNTYVAGFAATGGLLNLDSYTFPNQSTWLTSLKLAGEYDNVLYGVPYYAGDRVVIYNTSMFSKAGITSTPTTTSQLETDLGLLQTAESSVSGFCPIWIAGQEWYQIFSWLADANTGTAAADPIASYSNGKWTGLFQSSADETALTSFATFWHQYSSCAPADQTDTNYNVPMVNGTTAMVIEPSWAEGVIAGDGTSAKPSIPSSTWGVFPLPGASGPAPDFLGGSNLGVAKKSPNQAAAVSFLQYITNTQNMSDLTTVGGVIPNTTSLFYLNTSPAQLAEFQGAAKSWFTPATPGETTVENDNVYEDMLTSILTGTSVASAAATADQALNTDLNAPTS